MAAKENQSPTTNTHQEQYSRFHVIVSRYTHDSTNSYTETDMQNIFVTKFFFRKLMVRPHRKKLNGITFLANEQLSIE